MTAPLGRRLFAELLGSAFLAALVIGSGIAAHQLSPGNVGLQLLENAAATAAGLFAIILMFARTHRGASAPAAVGAYIGAAYWFTSSTSFANPAITIGRMFSNTFAGIAPASAPGFILAQLAGGVVAIAASRVLYPDVTPADAADVVLPHGDGRASAAVPAG